jgi:hypothetical protein
MKSSGDRVDTGTGLQRRRLTTAEAQCGLVPTPFTAEEWRAARITVDHLDCAMRAARQQRVAQEGPTT